MRRSPPARRRTTISCVPRSIGAPAIGVSPKRTPSIQTSAGSLAVKDAAANARPALLEPIAAVEITVPDAHVGAVMSDLSGRRGRVTGTVPDETAPVGMERTIVHAEVPDSELVRYTITLRSLTAGTGRFSRRFARLEVVPPNVADSLRAPAG